MYPSYTDNRRRFLHRQRRRDGLTEEVEGFPWRQLRIAQPCPPSPAAAEECEPSDLAWAVEDESEPLDGECSETTSFYEMRT